MAVAEKTKTPDLAHFQKLIEDKIASTQQELTSLKADHEMEKDNLEKKKDDQPQANTVLNNLERSIKSRQVRLHQLNNALLRIENDRYGICVSCQQDIPLARLKALPEAVRCVTC